MTKHAVLLLQEDALPRDQSVHRTSCCHVHDEIFDLDSSFLHVYVFDSDRLISPKEVLDSPEHLSGYQNLANDIGQIPQGSDDYSDVADDREDHSDAPLLLILVNPH